MKFEIAKTIVAFISKRCLISSTNGTFFEIEFLMGSNPFPPPVWFSLSPKLFFPELAPIRNRRFN